MRTHYKRHFLSILSACAFLFTTSLSVAGTVDLPRTGQTTSYAAGDDGAIQAGVPWPSPRFTDNGNGTVTDNLTELMWLKDANCINSSRLMNDESRGSRFKVHGSRLRS